MLITKPSWKLAGDRITQHVSVLACCLGLEESNISPGRVSYELRRLRLHGLIERIEGTHRYRLTPEGLGTVVFYQRSYARMVSVAARTALILDDRLLRSVPQSAASFDAKFTIEPLMPCGCARKV